MKRLLLCLISLVTVIACNSDDSIQPVSEKIQGPLSDYFCVVQKNYTTKDGKIFVEIKRIGEGFPEPWVKGMIIGSNAGEYEPQFTIEFQDKDGIVVSKDKTDCITDAAELNELAALGIGESTTITFKIKDGASQLKMGSTFITHEDNRIVANMLSNRTFSLEGKIGKYPIVMTMLVRSDNTVIGAYYYKSKGPGNYLYLKGDKYDEKIFLNEFTLDGKHTGTYDGYFSDGTYRGQFKAKSGTYDFDLSSSDLDVIDLSVVDFDSFNTVSSSIDSTPSITSQSSSHSGPSNIDEYLDLYEQFVDNYISFMKKAVNGDMSALAEYPTLLKKAEELSEKLEADEDDMTSEQLSRYIKITNKMSQAALEMM